MAGEEAGGVGVRFSAATVVCLAAEGWRAAWRLDAHLFVCRPVQRTIFSYKLGQAEALGTGAAPHIRCNWLGHHGSAAEPSRVPTFWQALCIRKLT